MDCPGNPWFICTLWMADYHIAAARTPEDLAQAATLIKWVTDHTLESGILAEQVHPYTGAPLSVSPLTWSHAALVVTIQSYVAKWNALTTNSEVHRSAAQAGPSSDPRSAPLRPMDAATTDQRITLTTNKPA